VAQRRKVGNLLALAVLSTLVQRPMHPYEMASVLRERGADESMRVKWGSLYTVVGNLEKHGLIAATESQRQGGRPERTVYRITETGRDELVDWVRELISIPEPEHSRFEAGLAVLGALGPDEGAELLRKRLALLEKRLAEQEDSLARHSAEIPRLFLVESEYSLAIRRAETDWVRALLAEFTTGSFPGLGQWRTFHETGEAPAELVALAERGSTED
jgi:DNA-binding PadR family transcriptional regulator